MNNNNEHTLRKVSELVEALNRPEKRQETMLNRQERLTTLVNEYGVEVVALAGGYTVSTLVQYLRVKNPSHIGEESVAQAERILQQL